VATALAERAGRGDHTGEVCHWVDGYHLNVRVYEKLLMSVFDILDESHLVEVLVLSCSIFFLLLNLLFLNLQEWQSIVEWLVESIVALQAVMGPQTQDSYM
jgi:hypothetical protein